MSGYVKIGMELWIIIYSNTTLTVPNFGEFNSTRVKLWQNKGHHSLRNLVNLATYSL